jgi:hypothetical protein
MPMNPKPLKHDLLEQRLGTVLRQVCPESLQLGEYQKGLLDPAEAAVVERHATDCPHCQVELQALDAFLGDELDTASLLDGLKEIVLVWGRSLASGAGLRPAFGIRGSAALRAQTFTAGHLWLAVTIQPDEDGHKKLLALVTREDGYPLEHGTAWLSREGRSVAGGRVDADGNLVIGAIAEGEYDLAIQCDGTRVWVRGVSV